MNSKVEEIISRLNKNNCNTCPTLESYGNFSYGDLKNEFSKILDVKQIKRFRQNKIL